MCHINPAFATLAPLLPSGTPLDHYISPGSGTSAISMHSLGSNHTFKSGTYCYLVRSLGSRSFQHTFPFVCIGEASFGGFLFTAVEVSGWKCFSYTTTRSFFFPSSIQHGATDQQAREIYSIYQFESVWTG